MSALYLGLCFSSSHKKEMSSFLGWVVLDQGTVVVFMVVLTWVCSKTLLVMEPLVDILSIGFIVLFGNSLRK